MKKLINRTVFLLAILIGNNTEVLTAQNCDAGALAEGMFFVCNGEFAAVSTGGAWGNIIYILHNGNDNALGTIYATSNSGIFTNDGTLPINQNLCISSVAGSDIDASGIPIPNGACYDISNCYTGVFLSEIEITFDQNCIDEGMVEVAYTITGGGAEYYNIRFEFPHSSLTSYDVIGTGGYANTVAYNETYIIGTFAPGATVSVSVNNDSKGCEQEAEIFILPCFANPCANPASGNQSCNVWPGDKNNDGIVDQKDVSIIGFLYETGPPRAPEHQNTDWYGHPCEDWEDNLPFNGANIKHLDCNGDGTISTIDAEAVIDNLGETHDEGGQQIGTFVFPETNYQIYLQPVDDLNNDNLLEVNVVLESKNGNNLTLQGGYFTIDYNNVNTNITNAAMNFTNSWLGSPNLNMIESFTNFPNFQQIEIGFSKTNGTNSTGKGIIGQLTFVLDNNAMRTANGLLDFEVIEIGVHDSQGNIQPIEEQLLQVGLNESNCQTNWTITEDSPFYNVYKSNGTIATDGFVLIGKEQQVSYTANRVRLNEGFSARAGADFKVRSSICN